jgi:hypothetical protein
MLRTLYLFENVGIEALEITDRALFAYENVGIEALEVEQRALFVYENVGIEALEVEQRALYVYEAVTDTLIFPYLEKISPTDGPVGTEITLTGDGFGAAQGDYNGMVLINSAELGISSWAWKEIRAVIPEGATSGLVLVRLTDPITQNSQSKFFLVTEEPLTNDARLEVKLYAGATLLTILDGAA